jgi:threonine aldolase
MINLKNDYCGICHHKILEALQRESNSVYVGYGLDTASLLAEDKIKKIINNENASVYFTVGGTSTNKIVIDHALKSYGAVIACDSGHINVHETGAIEATGHKVLTYPNEFGKLTPQGVEKLVLEHADFHMVKPGIVYISNSTEYGTVYTKEELVALSDVCKKHNLYFYIDGARLGCALTSKVCDYTMEDLAKLCDAFYIGGTKNGLILGEALVVLNPILNDEIRYGIKCNGGMYAKGFVNGICFNELFTDNLFFDIAKSENYLAEKLYNILQQQGVKFLFEQETNQIFPIFKTCVVEELRNHISFEVWSTEGENTVIRFVTSFLTKEEDILNASKIIIETMEKMYYK